MGKSWGFPVGKFTGGAKPPRPSLSDDQVEWLDNNTLLYSLAAPEARTTVINTWAVPADRSGKPRLLIPNAYSAVALRE